MKRHLEKIYPLRHYPPIKNGIVYQNKDKFNTIRRQINCMNIFKTGVGFHMSALSMTLEKFLQQKNLVHQVNGKQLVIVIHQVVNFPRLMFITNKASISKVLIGKRKKITSTGLKMESTRQVLDSKILFLHGAMIGIQ